MPTILVNKDEFMTSPEAERAVRLHQEGWEASRRSKPVPEECREFTKAILIQKKNGTWGQVRGQTETHFLVNETYSPEQVQMIALRDNQAQEEKSDPPPSGFFSRFRSQKPQPTAKLPKVHFFGTLGDREKSPPDPFGAPKAEAPAAHPAQVDIAYKPNA